MVYPTLQDWHWLLIPSIYKRGDGDKLFVIKAEYIYISEIIQWLFWDGTETIYIYRYVHMYAYTYLSLLTYLYMCILITDIYINT